MHTGCTGRFGGGQLLTQNFGIWPHPFEGPFDGTDGANGMAGQIKADVRPDRGGATTGQVTTGKFFFFFFARALTKFLTRFLARALTRVWGGEKTISTMYSTIRPKENTSKTTKHHKTFKTITPLTSSNPLKPF